MVLWKVSETCRVCLRKKEEMMSLTNGEKYIENVFSILSSLANCAITFNKMYPSFICTQCYAKLKIFEDLKATFDKTHKSLQKCFQNVQVLPITSLVSHNKVSENNEIAKVEEVESKIEIQEMPLPETDLFPLTDLIKCEESECFEVETEKPAKKKRRYVPRPIWKRFESVSLEEIREEIQKGEKSFLGTSTDCLNCLFIAASPTMLKNHVTHTHPELKETWCALCNEIFTDLEMHSRNHSTCVFCKRYFTTRKDLVKHLRTIHIKYYFQAVEAREQAQKTQLENSSASTKRKKVKEVKLVEKVPIASFPIEEVQAEINRVEESFKRTNTTCLKCDFVGKNFSALNTHFGRFHIALRNFWCPICNKMVDDRKQHFRNEHLKCKFCLKSFFAKVNLVSHMYTHISGGVSVFKCRICSRRFSTSELLESHASVHNLQNFKCSYCSKMFRGEKGLQSHVNILHKPFVCVKCKERFETDEELTKHECRGRNLKNFCRMCDKRVLSISMHNKEFHGAGEEDEGKDRRWLCNICGKRLTAKCKLDEHMRMHTGEKPFKCTFCDKAFTLRSSLLTHRNIHTSETPYLCRFCGKGFNQQGQLTVHEDIHAGKRSNIKCRICSKFFGNKERLRFHMSTHFGYSLKTLNSCECVACGKVFTSKASLNIHMTSHSNERRFQCNICNRGFKLKAYLRIHLATHSDEAPFKCNICERRFKLKCNMSVHVRTHSIEKPFKCELCSYASRQSYCLTMHMKTHGVEPIPTSLGLFSCNLCNRTFSSKEICKIHTKMKHSNVREAENI